MKQLKEKQGIKKCNCSCHCHGEYCPDCQPTEKPMEETWEEKLENVFIGLWGKRNEDGNFTIYQGHYPNITSTLKHFIKDLLKEEREMTVVKSKEVKNLI